MPPRLQVHAQSQSLKGVLSTQPNPEPHLEGKKIPRRHTTFLHSYCSFLHLPPHFFLASFTPFSRSFLTAGAFHDIVPGLLTCCYLERGLALGLTDGSCTHSFIHTSIHPKRSRRDLCFGVLRLCARDSDSDSGSTPNLRSPQLSYVAIFSPFFFREALPSLWRFGYTTPLALYDIFRIS